jgi:Zn-dependent protease
VVVSLSTGPRSAMGLSVAGSTRFRPKDDSEGQGYHEPVSQLTPEERGELAYYAGYEPPEPVRHEPRFRLLRKLAAPLVVAGGLALKFSFAIFKFFGIFISVGGYALIWGWKFAVGFVLLILVHELGHFIEAKRQGLDVSLPRFIPFFGAYVIVRDAPINPWLNSLVALAGPAVGGLGAAACLVLAEAQDSRFLFALAYTGFLLNLLNMIPVWILDGGSVLRSFRLARAEPVIAGDLAAAAGGTTTRLPGSGRGVANAIAVLYLVVAALLLLGAWAAHVPQTRL